MNGDLISRAKLRKRFEGWLHANSQYANEGDDAAACAIEAIDEAPAEDAEIVRHGWWTKIDASYWRWKHNEAVSVFRVKYQHDECGKVCAKAERYCPDCGAKMYAKEDA